jgi:hypothetical protein
LAVPERYASLNALACRALAGTRIRRAPMTTFDDREKSFEKKFALDQEMQFRVTARRDKLFGLWVATKLGLGGAEAEAYAKSIVVEDLKEAGDEDVLRKVNADLAARKVKIAPAELTSKLAELLAQAKQQLVAETKKS